MSTELNIIVANHLEVLADAAAELVSTPYPSSQANPLQPETILIQSKGMQRWLSMAIAERQGICANIHFPFPNAFMEQLYSQVVGPLPQKNVFDPKVLAYRIMALLPQVVDEPPFKPIRHYLKERGSSRKQFQLASKIADVFDQYQIFRPEMILDWDQGQKGDALSGNAWQPILWKKLSVQNQSLHRPALQKKLIAALEDKKGGGARLPQRISMFGISHLPLFHLQVLATLSQCIPVYLFLLNPCQHYWGDIVSDQQLIRARAKEHLTEDLRADDLHLERGNRLLASWGVQGQQFFNLIHQMDGQVADLFEDNGPQNLLGLIQQDILDLKDPLAQNASHVLNVDMDRSIQVHVCHSPMREVEVLRDQLVDLFEKQGRIEARDILVMTPDIGTYAPYIHAVFGNTASDEINIPYTVADQGMPVESRLIEGFLRLLDLYQSRFPVSQVMALLAYGPIRRRVGLEESDLIKIETWLHKANVRWGWDAAHCRAHNLPRFVQNTWRHGLDRLVLGYAMAADGKAMFADILPQEGVDAGDSHILGALTEFVERLYGQVGALPVKASMTQWHARLTALLDDFLHIDEASARDMQALRDAIDTMASNASTAEYTHPIPFEVVRDDLTSALNQASFGTGFMAGSMTFCAMLPMRSIPAKVICLLGLGYDSFPQEVREPAFNLAAAKPRPGDRSKRDDDKYLFLEALISARKVLYLSYVGRSIQDNSPIPPSVVIDELLEYAREGYGIKSDRLVTFHPLQAFSHRYFDNKHPNLFSYSKENLEASHSLEKRGTAPSFFHSALDEPDPALYHVTLGQMAAFFANPSRYLLERRLAVYLRSEILTMEDQENFNLDGLGRYKIKQVMLDYYQEGREIPDSYRAIRESGVLPHGAVGKVLFNELEREVGQFLTTLEQHLPQQQIGNRAVDLDLEPFRLSGMLDGMYDRRRVVYRLANVRPQDLLALYVAHLAMGASEGGELSPVTSMLVCQDGIWELAPAGDSKALLRGYLDLYWQGLQVPLPLFSKTSYEYAQHRHKGKPTTYALAAALKKWQGNPPYTLGESNDPYHRICFSDANPFTDAFEETALITFQPLLDAVRQL